MKFSLEHTFRGIDVAKYEALYLDEVFNTAMMPVAELKERKELERRDEGARLFRKIRVVPKRELPSVVKKFVNGEIVTVEDSVFDKEKHRIDWKQQLSILPGKLRVEGRVEFLPAPNGTKRLLTGEVDVSIFGVGGMIEKAVVDNIKETYDKIASFTQQWIDEGKA